MPNVNCYMFISLLSSPLNYKSCQGSVNPKTGVKTNPADPIGGQFTPCMTFWLMKCYQNFFINFLLVASVYHCLIECEVI